MTAEPTGPSAPPPSENSAVKEEVCLLAQVGAADRDAFRDLYARYSGPLFSLAIRMVGDAAEAEELLQDAFVKIWRHAPEFDARKSRPFTWAVTIMRRTCIDHLRKHRRSLVALPEETVGTRPDAGADSPHQSAVAQETAARLAGALAALPEPQRGALELAYFSGLSHTEISRRLTQPVGTVKSWIRRGLLDLRTALEHLPS